MLRKKLRLTDDALEDVEKLDRIDAFEINTSTSSYFHKKVKTAEVSVDKSKGPSNELLVISDELSVSLSTLEFVSPVDHVYNPTVYARNLYSQYVRRYGDTTKEILFLGMNPGPFGMCQTGVPFGNVSTVLKWLQLSGTVDQPHNPCPKRPIQGLNCKREEKSGERFWALFRDLCQTPAIFFKHAYVYNYCPVAFISAAGKNITPAEVRNQKDQICRLVQACDCALVRVVRALEVKVVVAIGHFVEKKAQRALLSAEDINVKVLRLLHPSPRSKQSVNWAATANDFLLDNNLTQYFTHSS